MAAISCMLIILVLIQVVWLRHAADAERREAGLRADKALASVSEHLREENFCVETYIKAYGNKGERFFMMRSDSKGHLDTVDMLYDENYSRDGNVGHLSAMGFRYPFSMEVRLSAILMIDDTMQYYNERDDFYEKQTAKRLVDVIRNEKPIDSIFSMQEVDSLLRVALREANADTVFSFAFISTEDNKIAWSSDEQDNAALMQSPHSVNLFADNKFLRPHRMAMIFPSSRSIYGLNSWLFVSIGIIALLTASFYALVRLYRRQTQLSQMKSDFINNLTHEFNTPMANISLALETLEASGAVQDDRSGNIYRIIATESNRLRDNIERALQVVTIEEGQLRLHKEPIELPQLLTTVITSYQLQCEALGGGVTFDYNCKCVIEADEPHILNCVVNLLDNAVKYRDGKPEIRVKLEEKANHVLLTVTDNGIGMSSETQKHIFDKFYRAHEGNTHNTKGFGLGLSYVKGIVEAHGGTIEVWSAPGTGTRFTIKLPKTINHDT